MSDVLPPREMPDWISQDPDKPNKFYVDPDILYPSLIEKLGMDAGALTQYDLEIVFGCMKLASDEVMFDSVHHPDKCLERVVLSDEGRKDRWTLAQFPRGDVDWTKLGIQERAGLVREAWDKVRGRAAV